MFRAMPSKKTPGMCDMETSPFVSFPWEKAEWARLIPDDV